MRIKVILFSILLPFIGFSQQGVLKGTITNAETGETLVGANVVVDSVTGVNTDIYGNYHIALDPGIYTLTYRFLGFTPEIREMKIDAGDTLIIDVPLHSEYLELSAAVVSAGKFQQRLSDVTVSMEIMKPAFIENTNTYNLETAITQMPGVDVLDGQANIRGGSGYSYGAGSRVMMMVDGLPILTADVNEVKWAFLPVENIDRVEIIKGASSALYGSSALNGVINVITSYPDEKPSTNVQLFSGLYLKPQREEMSWWWDTRPLFSGASFSHSRKIGDMDLVIGANAFSNDGYRELDYEERIRANVNFRHTPAKADRLTYGLNTNIQWQRISDFFIWIDADSGAWLQREDAVSPGRAFRLNMDPWITYFDSKNNKHSLKTRFYRVFNRFKDNPDKDNGSDLYYGEYQFQKSFKYGQVWTSGFSGNYGISDSELYGDHNSSNMAIFTQFDWMLFNRLNLSLGLRWERYTLDGEEEFSRPVVRAGLNYRVFEYTYIRASFGQGYRFPSIAEKYTATTVGAINIFPNPLLESEYGWSSELGLKHGVKISDWNGFVDVAAFRTEYQEMMEFTFGVYPPDSVDIPSIEHIGFKSLNIGNARINGVEVNISGSGLIGKLPLTFFAGYTYMNPLDLSADTLENNILKYRYRHSVKSDIQMDIKKFSVGIGFLYRSFMERVDAAFEEKILGMEIFPGLKAYRQKNNKGHLVVDLRASYQISKTARVSVIVKNIFNNEYMGRPGDIRPPRNIALQCVLNLHD